MPRELTSLANIVRKTGAHKRACETWRPRDMNAKAVERRTLAAFRGEHFVAHRIVNYADFHTTFVFQSDRNAETWIAVRVIRGAIERIDDPTPVAFLFAIDGFAGA